MSQRYTVTFSINESTVGEEYLGEFAVTDEHTKKDYTFFLRGDQESLNPEYVDEGTVFFPHIYVEDFYEVLDKQKFESGEHLAEYIDDRRIASELVNFIEFDDYDKVEAAIIHFVKTGENEPIRLTDESTQHGFGEYIVRREVADMLIRTKDEGFKKEDLLGFVETCRNVDFYLADSAKKTLEPDFKQALINHSLTLEESHKCMELFDKLQLSDLAATLYKHSPTVNQADLRYSVNVHSKPNYEKSEFELANIAIKDNLLDKTYNFAIWGDDDTFSSEYLQQSEIGATHIWVKQVENDIDLKALASVEELKAHLDDDALHSLDIKEFFTPKFAPNIAQKLVYHHFTGEDFNIRVEDPFFLQKCVPYFTAHEEIAEMAVKAKESSMNRKDVLSFAKAVKNPQLNFDYCELGFLEKPILQACKHSLHKPADKKAVKEIFEKLNLNMKLVRSHSLEHTR